MGTVEKIKAVKYQIGDYVEYNYLGCRKIPGRVVDKWSRGRYGVWYEIKLDEVVMLGGKMTCRASSSHHDLNKREVKHRAVRYRLGNHVEYDHTVYGKIQGKITSELSVDKNGGWYEIKLSKAIKTGVLKTDRVIVELKHNDKISK